MRKKEKPLSIEEIKDKIRRDQGPQWLHTEPLFGLMNSVEGAKLISTSDITDEKLLLVFLLDAADFVSERIFEVLILWKERYRKLPYQPVVVFQQNYLFLKNKKFFEHFKNHSFFATLPIYLDPFGDLFEKYGSKNEPTMFFLNHGELTYSSPLQPDLGRQLIQIESHLHQNLRRSDPGLPLPLLYHYEIDAPVDARRVKPSELTQSGQWMNAGNSIATDDPHASLTFGFEGKNLRFVGTLHPQSRENARIQVTLDQKPIPHGIYGPDIHTNDKGQTLFEIDRVSGLYEIIRTDVPVRGIIRFHFTSVIETPILFYELRTSE